MTKVRVLVAAIMVAGVAIAQEPVIPGNMAKLRMLAGEWLVQGKQGMIDFHYTSAGRLMIGRARKVDTGAKWRRFMVLYAEGKADDVRAEFFESNDHAIHYRLTFSDGKILRFADDPVAGAPLHQLTYEAEGPDRLLYRFETDHRITDGGTLVRGALLRPLESNPKLVRPLSEE